MAASSARNSPTLPADARLEDTTNFRQPTSLIGGSSVPPAVARNAVAVSGRVTQQTPHRLEDPPVHHPVVGSDEHLGCEFLPVVYLEGPPRHEVVASRKVSNRATQLLQPLAQMSIRLGVDAEQAALMGDIVSSPPRGRQHLGLFSGARKQLAEPLECRIEH